MFLDFTQLYLEFFAIVLGIIVLMVVGYLLISRPQKIEELPRDIKPKKVKKIKPIKNVKKKNIKSQKKSSELVSKEEDAEKKEANTDDLYDSNDDEQKDDRPAFKEENQFKSTVSSEENKPPLTTASKTSSEEKAKEDIATTLNTVEKDVTKINPSIPKEELSLGNEDDDEIIDDFEQVDQLIEEQRIVEKPKPVKPVVKTPKPKPKKKKVDLGRYHVLYKKEDNSWYVKREGSDRVVKTLETQREAFAFATIKAINQKTTVVVHKRDGKIKKGTL